MTSPKNWVPVTGWRFLGNKVGLFFYGPNQINIPLGDGRLCIGGVVRLNPPVIADGSGTATRHVDFTVFPAGLLGGVGAGAGFTSMAFNLAVSPAAAGLSVFGQWIFVDPGAGSGVSASEAFQLVFF